MIPWAATFLIVALVAAVLGFAGIAGNADRLDLVRRRPGARGDLRGRRSTAADDLGPSTQPKSEHPSEIE